MAVTSPVVTLPSPIPVILWGTGFCGKMVIKEILDNQCWKLVGVIVSDEKKNGIDVGELIGREPVGLAASTDFAEVLSRHAVAVAYYGPDALHFDTNIANIIASLEAGKHVVSTSMTPWVYPPACFDHSLEIVREPILAVKEACARTGRSCFTTGIDPGFINDLLPLTLTGVCGRVDQVRTTEIHDYSQYEGPLPPMGWGESLDTPSFLENIDFLQPAWGMSIPMIADALGVKVERFDMKYEKKAAEREIRVKNGDVIPAGSCGAVRFEIIGIVDGQPKIVLEHVNRLANDFAPEWPQGRVAETDVYRIEIKGSPNIVQESAFRRESDGDSAGGNCLASAMRALNSIPAVARARPGLLSALDLPIQPGIGVIRT